MKISKVFFILALVLGIWYFTNNFPPGYYLDQTGIVYKLYISFFNDLAQPFAFYFALCLFEQWIPPLKSWQTKALITFLVPACIEIGQLIFVKAGLAEAFMIYAGAFDPLDLLVYALAGLSAALVEQKLFSRLSFWAS